jgi:hypothetical protein
MIALTITQAVSECMPHILDCLPAPLALIGGGVRVLTKQHQQLLINVKTLRGRRDSDTVRQELDDGTPVAMGL